MGTRIHEAWGGNRVYDGTDWMELYYALELELYGEVNVQLTGNGKIPNGNSSVLGRLLVSAVFDANTLDNNNTFTLGGGRSPYFVSSSEPSVLPVPQRVDGNTFSVVPANTAVVDTGLPPGSLPVRTVMLKHTQLFNLTGQPAITLPIAAGDLPVGLQLVGRRGRTRELLALAAAVEDCLAV